MKRHPLKKQGTKPAVPYLCWFGDVRWNLGLACGLVRRGHVILFPSEPRVPPTPTTVSVALVPYDARFTEILAAARASVAAGRYRVFKLRSRPARVMKKALKSPDLVRELTKLAGQVFANKAGAESWMNQPQFGLGGRVPARVCRTKAGAKKVEDLLRRLDADVLP